MHQVLIIVAAAQDCCEGLKDWKLALRGKDESMRSLAEKEPSVRSSKGPAYQDPSKFPVL